MRIETGAYNRKITIQRATATVSPCGERSQTWSTLATPWARFRTMGGGEQMHAAQANAHLTHEIAIIYRAAITIAPGDRISYDGRTFDIKNIRDVDEAHIEIRMLCTESVPTTIASTSPSSSVSSSVSASVSASASSS